MNIQWFPGHMAKTRRLITENLKLVDVVIEIVDARVPQSSRNPLLEELVIKKPRIIILNKADLADNNITNEWVNYFDHKGEYKALKCNSIDSGTSVLKVLQNNLYDLTQEKREKQAAKGIIKQTVRTMIVGIPNVGKSTLINKIAGSKVAKTGNKPGVTKGKQWIRMGKDIELLDTPGILWPKFEDQEVGFKLAITGAINDDVFDFEQVALKFIGELVSRYPSLLSERYKLSLEDIEKTPLEILEKMGRNRGCIRKGNEVDYSKICSILVTEFRDGKIGKISLERPVKE
ncbi:Ras superfamily GTP-binding protein YlqF [Desulfonispora thiosulfatigenes DSM 11270]|uniref:Ribosome biogenesis GTPase A n=1 Tax=Desulfonispora thiosulfatigenes DSM 11270 TaxID=656914 RepID=A0A1W1VLN1_DESTI|nr:ribosome biogenesis GTPase YlqF [Desulfonispora thiosulfatigenes]SMB93854.1 Ras superfamily GTP-binding protein YlqF [Desulfonispora thiosulfatigenes DSM 11270]